MTTGSRFSRSTSKMAAQSYSQVINQQKCFRLFGYANWLSRYRHLKLEQLKICEACYVHGRHWENISNIKISRHTFVCHYFWNIMFRDNLTRIGQICIPYKFVQSGCIPPKIKCEILAHKKGSQTARQVRRLSRLLKLQTNGTTGPPGVNDDGSRFPRKKNPLQKRFFPFFFSISIAQWSDEEDNTIMTKVAKSKGKTRGKNGKKLKNVLRSQTVNRQTAFIIKFRGDC